MKFDVKSGNVIIVTDENGTLDRHTAAIVNKVFAKNKLLRLYKLCLWTYL